MSAVTADQSTPTTTDPAGAKGQLGTADTIVDALPWALGDSDRQRKVARGKVSALTHQIAALLAAGWSDTEIRTALDDAAPAAPDAGAQEKQWRAALNRAKNNRRATNGA